MMSQKPSVDNDTLRPCSTLWLSEPVPWNSWSYWKSELPLTRAQETICPSSPEVGSPTTTNAAFGLAVPPVPTTDMLAPNATD